MTGNIVRTIVFLLAALLAGCDSYELFDLLGSANNDISNDGGTLAVVPVSVTLEVDSVFPFAANGGVPPFVFSVVSGAGSIHPESGVYTAPSDASIDIVQVTDGEGSQSRARVVVVY